MRYLFAATLTIALAGSAFADPPRILSESVATIQQSHQYLMRDEKSGREFLVRVAEPTKKPPAGKKAAVFYVLDGNWYFGLAADIARMVSFGTGTLPSYVVAIGYNVSDFEDVVTNREHDMMFGHFIDRPEVGGGGAAFQSFLVNDLRPFIEHRYPIDSGRAYLAGQSLGGQFATRVLLDQPDSFAGYLIGSPSLWADKNLLPTAQRFTKGGDRNVMVGVGAEESPNMRANSASLAAALSRSESGLSVSTRIFENQNHMSMHGPWFAEGFRYLLDGPEK